MIRRDHGNSARQWDKIGARVGHMDYGPSDEWRLTGGL
ncbi:hypothetical protein XAP7430_330005 [Xanthomonas phaseoli pv. phaseoli]|uniref:Uncharacterized protein n=1 Tax=Xanthomonas campestris pv. phaseoli TaxID=317013 RepID=A0AB38E0K5_XANCH|nr:hypothetical protein XAP7430_330005 [Xanthomonas phaseoli pv. phaseoli]